MIEPQLTTPFPNIQRHWTCPKTGLKVPKYQTENIAWREKLLCQSENDPILQRDLLSACKESFLLWINAFAWTYHQWDYDDKGHRVDSKFPHAPFITWEIQDDALTILELLFKKGEDICFTKSREMGASWCCAAFLHHKWLFRADSQMLEMSRTREYVDQLGNMKALFQKHDYINEWLPKWMLPPECLPGEQYRTKMHMKNILNGSCIDGESTTEHAASGDRRLIILLDEFAKVENGRAMRSATRDAAYMRIVNSTPAGAGTEYSRWKNSGQIKVIPLMFWDHPKKGLGRYVKKTDIGKYEIRSPYFDYEESVRSPREIAQELLAEDIESGATFFTIHNVEKHIALFGCDPKSKWSIKIKKGIANDAIPRIIQQRKIDAVFARMAKSGPLSIWTNLILGRPDQSKNYIFGIDLGKGQGASPSVVSIKCKETGEKIGEWRDANTPPYEMARIVVALAIWCGGSNPWRLPFLKWEMNGPGWDFGRIIVKQFCYPYYYRKTSTGKITDKKSDSYGWHSSRPVKKELLYMYDRLLAHGGYVNHSIIGLEEAKLYIHYNGGGVGPATLSEESEEMRKTHGDIVIADALTLEDKEVPKGRHKGPEAPFRSVAHRDKLRAGKKRKSKSWRQKFDFTVRV